MIDHNKDNLEEALGVRDTFKEEVKESIFTYLKINKGLNGKKSHLIEYVKTDLNIQGENEMFLLGGYIKEFEMIVDMKDKVAEIVADRIPVRIKFDEKEFEKYINEETDDF